MNLSVAKVLCRKDAATQDKIILGLKTNINDIEKEGFELKDLGLYCS